MILRKYLRPILFIFLILLVNSILWVSTMKSAYLSNEVIISAVTGSSLLMGFMIVFLLSIRQPLIVRIFGGLENVYFWHRFLAILTTAMIFVHGFLATARGLTNIPDIFLLGQANEAGEFARNLFIGLILFALIAKFMKYEHFRYIHRLLIIPYIYALYHGFFTSVIDLFTFRLVSIWMIATSIIGLSSSIYMILIYQRTAFRFKGMIVEKTLLNKDIYEIKVEFNQPYDVLPGQFAFLKLYAKGFSKDPHPFSISKKDKNYLYFSIKALGDFTDLVKQKLEIPAKITVTKPYGDMTFNYPGNKQLWIAGGIGITPFLGYLRTQSKIDNDIHLVYSVKTLEDAVHLDLLRKLASENDTFNFSLHDTSKEGLLSIDNIEIDSETILCMCGPRSMVLSLKKQMRLNHARNKIVYEAFSFTGTLVEDIIMILKRLFKKISTKKK